MKIETDSRPIPQAFYDKLNGIYKFNFDPCPPGGAWEGLTIEWGQSNFINPPHSHQDAFVQKAIQEFKKGKRVVMLLPVFTSTEIFHQLILPNATEIMFVRGKIFVEDSMVVVFDPIDKGTDLVVWGIDLTFVKN